ncbi:hypothetical protein AVEN_98479-1 [Araneus ventricosus]|uniref:Uncharacterized protein n=1 Tax=Araneus ventricosus TaxID=182803 RepID=A0A4Y2QYA3_ARAVE|nr:hypothetical protein AVEN_98479-1 [Araneus ventricosus]
MNFPIRLLSVNIPRKSSDCDYVLCKETFPIDNKVDLAFRLKGIQKSLGAVAAGGEASHSGPEGSKSDSNEEALCKWAWRHIDKPYPDRTEAGNQSISLATRGSDVVFSSPT